MISSGKKIIHISTVHYWQDARIFDKECKSLARKGYNVILIIQYPGTTVKENVTILGLPIAEKKLHRITKVIPSMFKEVIKQERKSILHLHDPELLPFGVIFKLLGFKVIYDVHEDLPKDILDKEWIPKWIRSTLSFIMKKFEYITTATYDGVITVTPSIDQRFSHVNNVMVRNFPKIDIFLKIKPAISSNYIIYIGDIRKVRGAHEMVEAITYTKNEKVKLKLGGRIYPDSLRVELENIDQLNRTDFLGWIPYHEIPRLLSGAVCGMAVLHPLEGYKEAYPVKIFEYMAAGIPVIVSDFPLWRSIVEESGCGILVDPLNPKEIAEAINYMVEHPVEAKIMGNNGRLAVEAKYSWNNEEKKLLKMYEELSN